MRISNAIAAPINSLYEVVKNNLCIPEKWQYLVPTIGTVAIGAFYLPHVGLGLAAGVGIYFMDGIIYETTQAAGLHISEDTPSDYVNEIRSEPLDAALFVPIIEEVIYRGALQSLATRAIVWLVPTSAAALIGAELSIAVTISIVATSAIFAFAHYLNNHSNAHIQAIHAFCGSLAFGALTAQFGLGASMAAHIASNTISLVEDQIYFPGTS